jgi:hypothetical protein
MRKSWSIIVSFRNPGLRGRELFQFTLIGNRQLLTSFGTAARQYFTTIGSCHAFAETVNGLATFVMRLECTFHNYFSFFRLGGGLKCGRENGPVFKFHQQVTTPTVCERTAKVRDRAQTAEG